jgi:hypothetical protein
MFVAVSDDEFTGLLDKIFKKAHVAKCENHVAKNIGR